MTVLPMWAGPLARNVEDMLLPAYRRNSEDLMTTLTAAEPSATVTLRMATGEADHAVARLAQLDSAKRPRGPVIVAEVDGQARAALSLTDGSVVADPFHLTAGLVEMLRIRVALSAGVRLGRRGQVGRWRAASSAGTAAA